MAPTYRSLSESEIQTALARLPGWTTDQGKLHRSYRFADFAAAMAFMVQAGYEAERLDHHPNWSNVYNRVEVTLWTHDVGGLTDRDLELATAMERRATALVAGE